MANMKQQGSDLFFAQVKEPNEVRRNILETLKEIVEVLQRFEKFKRIRHEKLEKIHQLRGLIKDANKMLGNLRLKMPQTNLRAAPAAENPAHKKPRHKKKKKAKSEEANPEKKPKKEMTELEKLEAELGAIESKLKSLS